MTQSQDKQPGASGDVKFSSNSFNFAAWMVEGVTGISAELKPSNWGINQKFWEHCRAAQTESLLAIRSLLDQLIECSESTKKADVDREKRRARRGKISVG